jgi:hypothetical protein
MRDSQRALEWEAIHEAEHEACVEIQSGDQ